MNIIEVMLQDLDKNPDEEFLKQIKIIVKNNSMSVHEKSQSNSTALIIASVRGLTKCFDFLLQSGADLYAKDDYGATAKFCAENMYRIDILEIIKSFENKLK